MRMWTKGTARAALFTAGFVAVGTGAFSPHGAFADTTSGDSSLLGGNQINAPVSLPINVSGNSIAVIGDAVSHSKGGASVVDQGPNRESRGQRTSGHHSVGGGNQINAPVKAPINVCGNAVAVIGDALAECEGGAKVKESHGSGLGGGQLTSGRRSVLGGNQVFAPISIPVNVCGNAVAVIGGALAGCEGGAKVKEGHGSGFGGGQLTSGRRSVLGGNQVFAPISIPVNVCGNAIGNAVAGCEGGASVKSPGRGGAGGGSTSGRHSVGGGNQVHLPVKAPINVCGNAAAVLGDAIAGCAGGAGGHGGHGGYEPGDGYEPGGGYGHENGYGSRAAAVSRTLPALPHQTEALPLTGAALPTLPELPELPEQGLAGVPLAYSAAQSALPIDDPTIPPNLPKLPGLPIQPGQLPTDLPSQARQAPVAEHDIAPGLLPARPKLPVSPPLVPGAARPQALPIPAHDLPEPPVAGRADAARGNGAYDDLGSAHKPVTGLIPMSASGLLAGGMTGGSAYVIVVGAILAAAAAVMSLTRRVRFGRR